jgi:hypothetical protein
MGDTIVAIEAPPASETSIRRRKDTWRPHHVNHCVRPGVTARAIASLVDDLLARAPVA